MPAPQAAIVVTAAVEANFDGLVGPTHNYSGIAPGNLASAANRMQASNPRAAALQGLDKMRALADLGYAQGVLPPQERPDVSALRQLGFSGGDADVIRQAAGDAPHLLSASSSAAAMWVANAATVSPAADTADRRVHFTPANLASSFHRALEAPATSHALRTIFADSQYFTHHPALPAAPQFGDEGAANHTRLCGKYGAAGVELFVYGRDPFNPSAPGPVRYPARQTRAASEAIARLHGLRPERCVFAQQNPDAIDAGVFHNDVIAVGNRDLLFAHEHAFADTDATLAAVRQALLPVELNAIIVPESRVPWAAPCRHICSTASCSNATTADAAGGARRMHRRSRGQRVSGGARRQRWIHRRRAHLRPPAKHAQRRRAGVPAAARRPRRRGARRRAAVGVDEREPACATRRVGQPCTIATACCRPISPIRSCSSNRERRSTS
jgi:hypothetical protein